jgi:hypothetical protein
MTRTLFLLGFLLILGCFRDAGVGQPVKPTNEDDIREAVFRHIMKDRGDRLYFLSASASLLDEKDPSPEFLARFAGDRSGATVKPISAAEHGGKWKSWYVDRETGKQGNVLNIGPVEWLGKDSAQVEASWYNSGKAATGWRFQLHFENGKWVVKEQSKLWQS